MDEASCEIASSAEDTPEETESRPPEIPDSIEATTELASSSAEEKAPEIALIGFKLLSASETEPPALYKA
jgi:hypothetical protein